jgi:hypothetical protein
MVCKIQKAEHKVQMSALFTSGISIPKIGCAATSYKKRQRDTSIDIVWLEQEGMVAMQRKSSPLLARKSEK